MAAGEVGGIVEPGGAGRLGHGPARIAQYPADELMTHRWPLAAGSVVKGWIDLG